MRAIKMAFLAMTLAACAGRPVIQATPAQRAQAVTTVIQGGTVHDVATELGISDRDARRLVRSTVKDVLRVLQAQRGS